MEMEQVKKHLELLGYKAKDKVSGFKGTVASLSFDLYGCIQVAITPDVDKDGKRIEGQWFDASRINVTSKRRVMPMPDYNETCAVSTGFHGSAEKPSGPQNSKI